MNDRGTIGMSLQGLYKVAVVDGITGREVWRQPEWGKNLILNQGMDAIGSRVIAECFRYGVAGTGVRFNSILGGESSGSAINGMFSLFPIGSGIQDFDSTTYGGWVGGVLDIGDTLQMADGTELTVAAVGNVSASLTTNDTVASQSFVVWKTSQTGLQSETKRAGDGITGTSYYSGEDSCGTTTSSFHMDHHLRTYDFSIETSFKSYTEVGVAWDTDDSPVKSTFSRILLPAAVTVSGSQRLRLIYQLNVAWSPESASVVTNPPISGWPVAPATTTTISQSLQNLRWRSFVNSSGTSYTNYAALDPVTDGFECAFWGSTNSASLVPLGNSPVDRTTVAYQTSSFLEPYVVGSYRMVKYATWPKWVLNYTTLRTFGIGMTAAFVATSYTATGQSFVIRFEESQSKYSTQELTMKYLWTWRRVLAS